MIVRDRRLGAHTDRVANVVTAWEIRSTIASVRGSVAVVGAEQVSELGDHPRSAHSPTACVGQVAEVDGPRNVRGPMAEQKVTSSMRSPASKARLATVCGELCIEGTAPLWRKDDPIANSRGLPRDGAGLVPSAPPRTDSLQF